MGTPEYQEIFCVSAKSKNLRALKPLLAQTDAPTFAEALKTAINPCI